MEDKNYCRWCGKEITGKGKRNKKFCCRKCYNENHKLEHYKLYLADNSIAWGIQNMQQYKKYFLEEQNHKCAICGCDDVWQGKQLVFILDHIDGNSDNNNRDNLRLICPNCDSQLDTYKSKNKTSARRNHLRKEKYYQNKDN